VGDDRDPEPLLQTTAPGYRPFGRNSRGEIRRLGLQRDIAGLIERLGDDDLRNSPKLRRYAIFQLMQLGDVAAVPALSAALADTDGTSRLYAAAGLSKITNEAVVPVLIGVLRSSHSSHGMKLHALNGLGRNQAQDAITALIASLDDPDWRVVRGAALRLAKLGDSAAIDPLRRARTRARWRPIHGYWLGFHLRELEERTGRS
jgi:HEAT repeat protein